MTRKNETMDLYGEIFKVVKGTTKPYKRCNGLYDAYVNPSTRKENIWSYWLDWFSSVLRDNNGGEIYITSYNAQFFSIGGYIESPLDQTWCFYITSTRQEVYRIR